MSADIRHRPLIVTDGIGGAHRTMSDGFGYFLRRWSAGPTPRATLVFLHGIGAHSGWFAQLGAALAAEGVASYAFDLPGHGYTQGPRGDFATLERTGLVLEDTVRLAGREHRDVPMFLGGLSLGGILALREAVRRTHGDATFGGYVSMSPPMIDTFIPPLDKIRMLARLPFAPTTKAKCPLGYGTRVAVDDGSQRCAESDPLGLREVTVRTYWNVLKATLTVALGAPGIAAPVLLMIGGQDRVGSPASMRWLAHRISGVTVREYPELGHDIKIEPRIERVAHDIAEWLAAHAAAPHAA